MPASNNYTPADFAKGRIKLLRGYLATPFLVKKYSKCYNNLPINEQGQTMIDKFSNGGTGADGEQRPPPPPPPPGG